MQLVLLYILLLVIVYCNVSVNGFTWNVRNQEIGSDNIVKLSEQYIYGTHNGPLEWLIPGGVAYFESDIYLEAM